MDFKNKTLLTLILLLFFTFSSIGQPKWINNYKKKYPDTKYISGIGISNYKGSSEIEAMQSISSQFKIQLKANINSNENITETNNTYESNYNLNSNIQTNSNINLKNIKISEVYYDKKEDKYYVLATLNKRETASIYQNDRSKILKEANTLYKKSNIETNLLKKLQFIGSSIYKYKEIDLINEKLSILSKFNINKNDYQNIILEKNKLLNKINVSILKGENDNTLFNSINKEITDIGFKINDNEESLLEIVYNVKVENYDIKNKDRKFVIWDLSISLKDNSTKKIFGAFNKKGRVAQISYNSARKRANYEISKTISKEFKYFLIENLFKVK